MQVVDALGTKEVAGQLTAPAVRSFTPTEVRVTLPVLVTMNVYGRAEPATVPASVPARLSSAIEGDRVTGVLTELVAEIAAPVGGVPAAVAVLATPPASTSACVSVYVFVQVVDAPGASVLAGHETVPTVGSVTPTLDSVTLPVFLTTNVYMIVEPAVFADGAPADFTSVIAGTPVMVVSVESALETTGPDGGVPAAVAVLAT